MTNWRGKSLWSVSSRFAAAGLAFLLNIVLVRSLSQNDLGHFYLNWSLAWGGALLCQWGASMLAVKWVATARARGDHEEVRSSTWSLIGFTLLHGLIVSVLMVALLDRPLDGLMILAAWTFAAGMQNLVPEIVRGFDDLKWASLLSGPIPQICIFVSITAAHLIWKNLTYSQAAIFFIAGSLACSAFGLVLIARRAAPTFRLMSYKRFIRESTPIALSLSATYLLSQADLWVCSALLTKGDVAVYGIAQRFVAFVSMPMMIFGSVVTPTISEALALQQKDRLHDIVAKGTFITSAFALAVFLGGLFFGWPIMKFLFGETYTAAYPLFLILGMGQVLHAMAGPNGYLLLLSGYQGVAMLATIASAAILGVSAWMGGIEAGSQGIAIANSFALMVQTLWMWTAVRHYLKMNSHFQWRFRGGV